MSDLRSDPPSLLTQAVRVDIKKGTCLTWYGSVFCHDEDTAGQHVCCSGWDDFVPLPLGILEAVVQRLEFVKNSIRNSDSGWARHASHATHVCSPGHLTVKVGRAAAGQLQLQLGTAVAFFKLSTKRMVTTGSVRCQWQLAIDIAIARSAL